MTNDLGSQLEERLGVRLVNRTTRTSSLTPEGETYLHYATHILADLHEMEEAVSSTRAVPRGLLRVNASLGFGRTTIAPLVSRFAQRYPQVEVQLDVTDRPVDLVADGIDLAIRFGELPDQRLVARRIMSNRRLLCASPRYLERHGTPASLAQLVNHRCIVLPGYAQPEADLFVVYPNKRRQSARARAFIDFLVAHFGA